MNIDNLTLEEIENLKTELNRKEYELKKIKLSKLQIEAKSRIEYIKKYSDIILPLIEHERTSCSDTNICNGYESANYGARCMKCFLLEILDNQHGNKFQVDFVINILNTENIM